MYSPILLTCLLVGLCHCKSSLRDVADEVRRLEQDLAKLENHDVGANGHSMSSLRAAKRELENAVKQKKESSSFDDEIKKLEAAKRELQKSTLEKLLAEDKPVEDDSPVSQAKREIYTLMKEMMDGATKEHYEELDSQDCKDTRPDCAALTSRCDHASMREECARTCNYCLFCEDSSPQCAKAADMCDGEKADIMKTHCNKTCGYCRTPSPKPCEESKFGCCWDKATSQIDKDGSNCPACVDQYMYACDTFKPNCFDDSVSGLFMRERCPVMCGLCGVRNTACFDSPGLEEKCKVWDENKWCTLQPSVMDYNCKKTCGICKSFHG